VAPLAGGAPFFGPIVVTGSHGGSLRAVADGDADIAAIDCVTFALIVRAQPELCARVAVVTQTPASPCLPFIASLALPAATRVAVQKALFEALADPALAEARAAIGLKGARAASADDYTRVLDMEREAVTAGYPALA
jgi:ABC-type phosphate/phosphonate transport system substrate-binding protein